MTKPQVKEVEVQEAEIVEEEVGIQCELTVGINENGDIYLKVGGTVQSLVTMDGLLKYAERHIEALWKDKVKESFETK